MLAKRLKRAGLVTARREGLWMHYGLAEPGDAVIATIQQAVTHALGHIEAVKADAKRLQARTGCCPPASAGAPVDACCASHGGD